MNHRIHLWYIYNIPWCFFMLNVGQHTSPMDAMGGWYPFLTAYRLHSCHTSPPMRHAEIKRFDTTDFCRLIQPLQGQDSSSNPVKSLCSSIFLCSLRTFERWFSCVRVLVLQKTNFGCGFEFAFKKGPFLNNIIYSWALNKTIVTVAVIHEVLYHAYGIPVLTNRIALKIHSLTRALDS